ncbi:MAG TPA: lamin tail domain-containing protein, partial [Candidatus Limnocylindria bacterium]|nr:lamin tail domain-containing protein [Candidatus Limnocylindria bacterium]
MISTRPHRLSQAGRRCLAVAAAAIVMLAPLPTVVAFNERATDAASAALTQDLAAEPTTHLVVSEVMTGGASASDEFIEIYNPGPDVLPLEGLEVIYVTASGGTITRKASWAAGAPSIAQGNHVLIANDAGVFAGVADVTYTNGLAATGGSVAIRILGASSAIDAAGWGNATSTWLEGVPAAPPPAGHSLERLPGGSMGSGQDSDQNSVDFVDLLTPDPQNTLSPPIPVGTPQPSESPAESPTATPSPTIGDTPEPTSNGTATPTPEPSSTPSPEPSVTPSASPSPPSPLTIAAARVMPDGSVVTVEGTTLTDSAFTDGGGYLVDATGGIAVLLSEGTFARGQRISVTGAVDDRFSQRTIRADASAVRIIGPGLEPAAEAASTSGIGESLEGELIVVAGAITATPSTLTSGIALDLDDGSGAMRVLVSNAT